jgi:hypothetical protein
MGSGWLVVRSRLIPSRSLLVRLLKPRSDRGIDDLRSTVRSELDSRGFLFTLTAKDRQALKIFELEMH